jgi:hypothetical protein
MVLLLSDKKKTQSSQNIVHSCNNNSTKFCVHTMASKLFAPNISLWQTQHISHISKDFTGHNLGTTAMKRYASKYRILPESPISLHFLKM